MTKATPTISVQRCPSCGSALNRGALTCSYCGSVTAVENVTSRMRSEIRYLVGQAAVHLQDRTVLIWVLALIPGLILPPLVALLMCIRGSASGSRTSGQSHLSIVIVAIGNIVLSVLFWRWLSEISMSAGLSFGLFLKSLGIESPRASLQAI